MTELLERAIARLKTLSASEQEAIAAMALEELIESFWLFRTCYAKLPHAMSKILA